jgi:hypothetical protein
LNTLLLLVVHRVRLEQVSVVSAVVVLVVIVHRLLVKVLVVVHLLRIVCCFRRGVLRR